MEIAASDVRVGMTIEVELMRTVSRIVRSITPAGKKMGTDIPILRFEFTAPQGIRALEVAADQSVTVVP